jgi:hypothetical protein
MYPRPKQQFGLFEATLSGTVLAAAVFLSFHLFGDIRQPETVRLTYLGLQDRGAPERPVATIEEVKLCPDTDLPCLPSSLDGARFAERRSD